MVTLAQRLETLRAEKGLTRPALSTALGMPRNAIEKFETGRQTPTKEQQNKIMYSYPFAKPAPERFLSVVTCQVCTA